MAYNLKEARLKRSQLVNQCAGNLLRLNSPISSTGSCHGTVVSDTTSEFFSEIEEDFANGDIWNSTGNLNTSPKDRRKKNDIDNIRSTTKKHGRWEPRSHLLPIFQTSAIANEFPDFTSLDEATIEGNRNVNSGESISIELARGHKQKPNMASPRYSQSHQELKNASDPHNTSNYLRKPTAEPSKSYVSKDLNSTPRASNKSKSVGTRVISEQKKIARTTVHRSTNITSSNANAVNINKRELRSSHSFQPESDEEVENSILTREQPAFFTNATNSTGANTYPSKYFNKISLTKKSSRYNDSRYCVVSDGKSCSKNDNNGNLNDVSNSRVDNYFLNTPSKRTNRNTQMQNKDEQIKFQGNPTQTTTSFLIPWNDNLHLTTSPNNDIPVFTAQGQVQSIRLPHEYIDGIDLPFEEEQIYNMIDNMNGQARKTQDILECIERRKSRLSGGEILLSSTRRSDSGLGESGSEVLGSIAGSALNEHIHKANNENYQGTQTQSQNKNEANPEIQRLSLLNEDLERQLSDTKSANKEAVAENWARIIEIRELTAKVRKIQTEKRRLEQEIVSNKQKLEEKEYINKASCEELKNLRQERERDTANWSSKSQEYESQIKNFRTEINELHRKLARSEKSCKVLKENTEKILESTRILETTKIKRLSKKSSQKENESKIIPTSKLFIKRQTSDHENPVAEPTAPVNDNNNSIDFDISGVSYSDGESLTHSIEKDITETNNFPGLTSSNFSDILGHGFAEKMRNGLESINELVEQQNIDSQTDLGETENITRFENTTQSVNSNPPLNLVTNTSTVTTPRKEFSKRSTLQRTKSLNEKNVTTVFKKSSRCKSTSALREVIPPQDPARSPDINKSTFESKVKVQKKSYSKSETSHIMHSCADHNSMNCSVCIQKISMSSKSAQKTTIRIEKPIPVSDRMPVTEPYEDQPTLRPSTSPGLALARAIKANQDEIEHIKQKYLEAHSSYLSQDASIGKSSRRSLRDLVNSLFIEMENKKDQLYRLYDVLEGQKTAGQEMTSDFLDVTLTNIGIKFDDTWNGCEN
ncbi:hypothetical protein HI914_04684 [Erysiphe necator]|nr:hypothetical protein HI914_04684 [Erysiphe necator]